MIDLTGDRHEPTAETRAPLRVALIGAGFIGTDLLVKIKRSPLLDCRLVVGRTANSAGLRWAGKLGYPTSDCGISALENQPDVYDLVFDATDAVANEEHWRRLDPLGKAMISLTPSRSGLMVAPTINGAAAVGARNVNLISCGGQAAAPAVHALGNTVGSIRYLEVVTTAASRSVGEGTRMNLDEFIDVTSLAVANFSGAKAVKALVNLSPANPPSPFRVSVSAIADGADQTAVEDALERAATEVRTFCPGYRIAACEVRRDGSIFIAIDVTGRGDRLPPFAGNLDIINAAAVAVAECMALDALPSRPHQARP